MEKFAPHIYTFILPLFMGNLVHMLIVKGNYFPSTSKPLSIAWFRPGKTYRAFIVMPLICGFTSLFFRSALMHAANYYWSFGIGFILGVTYLIGELPNSFIKRRLGISSGQVNQRYRIVQYIIDKTDSLFILCIVYFFIANITVPMLLVLFVVSFSIHVTFSLLLLLLGIKKSF